MRQHWAARARPAGGPGQLDAATGLPAPSARGRDRRGGDLPRGPGRRPPACRAGPRAASHRAAPARRRLRRGRVGLRRGVRSHAEPLFGFLYDRWWRVEATGVENVPAHGRGLLAANHAGILPWDATMMAWRSSASTRCRAIPRFLVLDWAFELPYVSVVIRRFGGVVASPYNALRLLEQDQLVAVFPRASRAPASRSASATGCSASVAAASWRWRCAPVSRSCRWPWWEARRSTPSSARRRCSHG